MSKAYSLDLRERIVGHNIAGGSCRSAARYFGVTTALPFGLGRRIEKRVTSNQEIEGDRRGVENWLLSWISWWSWWKPIRTSPCRNWPTRYLRNMVSQPIHLRSGALSMLPGSHIKNPLWRANLGATISAKRVRNGPINASQKCGRNRLGSSFSMKPAPRRRWTGCAAGPSVVSAFMIMSRSVIEEPRPSSPVCVVTGWSPLGFLMVQ